MRSNVDTYLTILLDKECRIKPTVLIDEEGIRALTCQYHDGGEDKLALFSPQSPNGYILNAQQSDQLAHLVKIPRISSQTKAMSYSTKFSMVQCRSGFSGVDTMNVTSHSDFSKTSELLSIHEDTTLIGRPDIHILLIQKVRNNQISSELANEFIKNSKKRYSVDHLRKHAQGSTYVSFNDMVTIHLHESLD